MKRFFPLDVPVAISHRHEDAIILGILNRSSVCTRYAPAEVEQVFHETSAPVGKKIYARSTPFSFPFPSFPAVGFCARKNFRSTRRNRFDSEASRRTIGTSVTFTFQSTRLGSERVAFLQSARPI